MRTLPTTMMILFVAPIAGKLGPRIGPRALMTFGMLTRDGRPRSALSFIDVDTSLQRDLAVPDAARHRPGLDDARGRRPPRWPRSTTPRPASPRA